MAQGNPLPGEKYLHFKNRLYQVIAVAYHSETMERFVVYQALYGDFKVYIRPYDMFVSEVDHEKYPEVTQRYRFQCMNNFEKESGDGRTKESERSGDGRTKESERSGDGGTKESECSGDSVPKESAAKTASDEKYQASEPTHVPTEQSTEPRETENLPEGMNPWLARFLDADDFHEKYRIVCDMYPDVTDRLIDDIAVVMDVVIPEGKLSERYAQLKYCIRTRQKYESTRLR